MTWQELKNNPAKWKKFFIREKIVQAIRDFFYRQNFHEVETPVLVPAVIPESYLDIFKTCAIDRRGKKKEMFLAPSPEVSLKKLLAAGLGDCFEITKSFRNREAGSGWHNSEFTMLEWYRLGADYRQLMDDCENLFIHIYQAVQENRPKQPNNLEMIYQKRRIDLSSPWERISMPEALKKYAGITLDEISSRRGEPFPLKKIAAVAQKKGYTVGKKDAWEQIFNQIFLNEVEPHLGSDGKPTIIYDYPRPLAALAKAKKGDPRLAERMEIYAGGLELADGYTELTDYNEQKKRFQKETKEIKKLNKTPIKTDEDFLAALKAGLPPCAGIALGLDRLAMLFTDSDAISEVRFFTT